MNEAKKPHRNKGKSNSELFGNHNERKSGFYSWLYYNEYLRRVIVAKLTTIDISRRATARKLGVAHPNLLYYLNRKYGVKKGLTDLQILRLCDFIGIEINLEIGIVKR